MDAGDIELSFAEGKFTTCQFYTAHATTNASHEVTDIRKIQRVLEVVQRINMPLLLYSEVKDHNVDIFDREAIFIESILAKLIANFPAQGGIRAHHAIRRRRHRASCCYKSSGSNYATPIGNQSQGYVRGWDSPAFLLPAKPQLHRLAMHQAATSGSAKFFLGTDPALNAASDRKTECRCTAIFNAPFAFESCATMFDKEGALDQVKVSRPTTVRVVMVVLST